MKRFFLLVLFAMGAPAVVGAAGLNARDYYQFIIQCQPFGAIAANDAPAGVALSEQDQQKVQEESNKIQLCAMTITPDGQTAVGLIDNGVNPPAYITLFDGEEANGLEMLLSDLDGEIATFRRGGVTFTLGLGLGLIETVTPELLAQRKAEAEQLAAEEAEIERKRPNSIAEQLIALQMSVPPNVEAPPLPIPMIDPEEFTREFDPGKEESEPTTEREALVKAGVAQLKESMAVGEAPQEYLARLVEHRNKEVRRQQVEQEAAEAALEEALATPGLSKDAQAALRRQANIDLMKKGVEPLSPVRDLSPEEQAEIDAALETLP